MNNQFLFRKNTIAKRFIALVYLHDDSFLKSSKEYIN